MWWIAFFPLAGIIIGVLLYFLRPMFGADDFKQREDSENENEELEF